MGDNNTLSATTLDLASALRAAFEEAPVGLGLWDLELRYVYVNRALAAINGVSAEAHLGKTIAELLPGIDAEVTRTMARVIAEGVPVSYETSGETPAAPGHPRAWVVHHFPLRVGAAIVGVGAVCEDITARRHAETLSRRRDAERREIAEALPQIVWLTDADNAPIFYNRKFSEYTGLDLASSPPSWAGIVHDDDLAGVLATARAARARGEPFEISYRLRRRDGVFRWHLGRVVPLRGASGALTWLGAATDVDDQKRFLDEQKYLADASVVLGTSLDVDRTLKDVARLVVPHLSDWCAIDLLDDSGAVRRAAVAHVDPDKVALAWEIWARMPPRPEDPTGVYQVMRTQQPEVNEAITDDLLVAAIPDPDLLRMFRALGLCSSVCVPLVAAGRALGTLTLVMAESRRRYEARDVAFAQELGRRIAIAVDNARLYTEATRARAAAEAIAADVISQTEQMKAALIALRAERDGAVARLAAIEAGRGDESGA